MPRGTRLEMAGAMHHVTARAPKGLALFREVRDRSLYIDLLASEVAQRDWSLRTFCLMGNHVHLLVVTPRPDLGLGIGPSPVTSRRRTSSMPARAKKGTVP